jgi:acyl carrier protein
MHGPPITEDVKPRVREFLSRYIRRQAIGDQTDIFLSGLVNSLFAMQLLSFVEKEFQILITDGDLEIDNFRSIAAITAFVKRKHADVS